uniref:Uncharacterized protein n=1 Tax=Aegilops tauschii subsp. strangulata TaxID=200361 RepID=A0A453P083_AEGTS
VVRLRLRAEHRARKNAEMRFLGLVSLVALIFLLSFRSLLHQQVLVGKYVDLVAVAVTLSSS